MQTLEGVLYIIQIKDICGKMIDKKDISEKNEIY